jgi:hypothetical protein
MTVSSAAVSRVSAWIAGLLFTAFAATRWDREGRFPKQFLPLGLSDPLFRCRLTLRD